MKLTLQVNLNKKKKIRSLNPLLVSLLQSTLIRWRRQLKEGLSLFDISETIFFER